MGLYSVAAVLEIDRETLLQNTMWIVDDASFFVPFAWDSSNFIKNPKNFESQKENTRALFDTHCAGYSRKESLIIRQLRDFCYPVSTIAIS